MLAVVMCKAKSIERGSEFKRSTKFLHATASNHNSSKLALARSMNKTQTNYFFMYDHTTLQFIFLKLMYVQFWVRDVCLWHEKMGDALFWRAFMWTCDLMWAYVSLCELMWAYMSLYELVWAYVSLYELIWAYMSLYELVWAYVSLYELI